MSEPGTTVDRYELLGVLGEGGMAVVYRARHTGLGTFHAVKRLHAWKPGDRARLVQEARIQARLRHPNVVPVTDLVEAGDDVYVVMDLVDGPSLGRWALRHPGREERLAVFRGVVAGVGAAHAMGVVHRDLKPQNVLMAGDVPRVADFGLARPSDDAVATRTSAALGTPAYMAPEQWADAATVDERADVWSLGCMLFELLTDQRVFPQEGIPAIAAAVMTGTRAPLPADVDAAVRAAVDGCLRVDRAERLPSAQAVLDVLDGKATATPPSRVSVAETTFGPDEAQDRAAATLPPDPTLAPPSDALPKGLSAGWAGRFSGPPAPQPPAAVPTPASAAVTPPPSLPLPSEGAPLPEPPPAGAKVVRVPVLLADPITGQASVASLVVHGKAGRGEVHGVGRFAADALQAVEIAVRAALGERARRWEFWWLLDGVTVPVEGPSLGLGAAVAVLVLTAGGRVPADAAFSGRVALDGAVAAVGYLPAKQRAAKLAGYAQVWTGPGVDGPDLVGVPTVDALRARLSPPAWRGRLAAGGLLAIGPLVALLGVGASVDLAAAQGLLRVVDGRLPAAHTVVVGVPMPADHDLAALRPTYGPLVKALAEAGVAAVAFDIALVEAKPGDDTLAADLAAAGIPIVLGARTSTDGPVLPKTPALAAVGRPGLALVEPEWPAIVLGRVPAAQRWPGATVYALSVEAVQALSPRARGPETDGATLVAGGRSVMLDSGRFLLHPAEPAPVIGPTAADTAHPWSAVELRGRVALIGVLDAVDVIPTATGAVPGVQVHAAAIETLLAGRPPRAAGTGADTLAAGVTAALGFVAARVRPVLLGGVGVLVLGFLVLSAKAAVLFAAVPLVVALGGAWFAARVGRRGGG